MSDKIDFLVEWVDGNDPVWQKTRNEYLGIKVSEDNAGVHRYRDWDLMRYWFRGVEKYAPWVNKVYFVTCGQRLDWLNEKCEKLVLIDHKDYMPKESLPTFNSSAIEVGLHKIPGLSEQFVLFNDDCFPTAPMTPEDFFVDGLPCDYAALDVLTPSNDFEYLRMNNVYVINKFFSKSKVLSENRSKWFSLKDPKSLYWTLALRKPWTTFSGFRDYHVPLSFTKQNYETVWAKVPDLMYNTQMHRFRSKDDVSSWLVRYWRLCEGKFYVKKPNRFGYTFIENDDIDGVISQLENHKKKILCINDEYKGTEFEKTKKRLIESFERILPEKSSFEI